MPIQIAHTMDQLTNDREKIYEEGNKGCLGIFLITLLIVCCVVVAYVLLNRLSDEDDALLPAPVSTLPQPAQGDAQVIQLTPEQWTEHLQALNEHRSALNEHRTLVNELRSEINTLSLDIQGLRQRVSALENELAASNTSSGKSSAPPKAKNNGKTSAPPKAKNDGKTSAPSKAKNDGKTSSEGFRPDALILAGYEHNYLSPIASFAVRNNTQRKVSEFKVRITYYDMRSQVLDYKDITKKTLIEPGMVRVVNVPGYAWEEKYVFHTSKEAHLGKKYRVSFDLLSYTLK